MAYILLALGAAMSLAGLAAMATGYPMIEIERGWATVITGAVLLSGGLVVVALGFVVRHLVELRGVLVTAGTPSAGVPQPMVVPTPLMPPAPIGPALSDPPATSSPAAHPFRAEAMAAAAATAALGGGALLGREEPETPYERPHALEASSEAHDPHSQESETPEAHVHEVHPPETSEPPNYEAHEAAEHAAEPVPAAAPDRPRSSEDWLDQAFSAFDYEMTNGHPPTKEAQPSDAHEPHPELAPEPVHADAAHEATAGESDAVESLPHTPDAQHAGESEPHPQPHQDHAAEIAEPPVEAPATAPDEPDPNLAVIGRYDSEGTSYVMYSDGSIEAQSESGVYRFGSMAELKAFIEG